jgi:hypothetical protein
VTEYIVGAVIWLAIAVSAAWSGMDRSRAFYPTALIVIAFYYVLFAAMGGSMRVVGLEIAIALGFSALAVFGFMKNMWLVAVGIAGHGIFDLFHHLLIANPGMPIWWPGFCATVDVLLGVWMGFRMARTRSLAASATR